MYRRDASYAGGRRRRSDERLQKIVERVTLTLDIYRQSAGVILYESGETAGRGKAMNVGSEPYALNYTFDRNDTTLDQFCPGAIADIRLVRRVTDTFESSMRGNGQQ